MEILISSVLVCLIVMVVVVNGSCCFCFVLLFNGRRWNFSCFSSNPTEKQLGLCFPFQTKRSRHVLDISVFAASIHPTPVLEKGLPAKQEAAHSWPFSQGLGSLDAMASNCKVLLCFSSLEVEGDWAWLLLWKEDQPHFLSGLEYWDRISKLEPSLSSLKIPLRGIWLVSPSLVLSLMLGSIPCAPAELTPGAHLKLKTG